MLFALLCTLQIGLLSTAVVSPQVHLFVFHEQSADGASCSGHHHGTAPVDDDVPEDESYCPVVMFLQGLTVTEASASLNWEYVTFNTLRFTEPESLFSSFTARHIRQRAPPCC